MINGVNVNTLENDVKNLRDSIHSQTNLLDQYSNKFAEQSQRNFRYEQTGLDIQMLQQEYKNLDAKLSSITRSDKAVKIRLDKRFLPTNSYFCLILFCFAFMVISWGLFLPTEQISVLINSNTCLLDNLVMVDQSLLRTPITGTSDLDYTIIYPKNNPPVLDLNFPTLNDGSALTECVSRFNENYIIHTVCGENINIEFCRIAKIKVNFCKNDTTPNTVYFFDDLSQRVYGGVIINDLKSFQALTATFSDNYTINLLNLTSDYNTIIMNMVNKLPCKEVINIPKFILNDSYLKAASAIGILFAIIPFLASLIIWIGAHYCGSKLEKYCCLLSEMYKVSQREVPISEVVHLATLDETSINLNSSSAHL